jgi:archaetidylinositol phosphate synthase
MTLDQLRPHLGFILAPLTRLSMRAGLTPNRLSVMAFIASVAAGFAFYAGEVAWATVLVAVNALLDALDGTLAREMQLAGPRGDFLDHVLDRYADIFIITGIIAGTDLPWIIGIFGLTGVLMSSYMGTQAQAVGVGRYYGGTLGRADRLLLIILAGFLTLLFPAGYLGLTWLGWLLVIFGIFGHATAIQRFFYVWGKIR